MLFRTKIIQMNKGSGKQFAVFFPLNILCDLCTQTNFNEALIL